MFDRYEAIELLQSLVRPARNEAHEKADLYAAALDEVRARADLLDNESLQRLLVGLLGDPVRAKIAKEANSILKSSTRAAAAPSRGLRYARLRPYGNVRCFNCNRFGHMARECQFNQRPSQFPYRGPRGGFRGGKISLALEEAIVALLSFLPSRVLFFSAFHWLLYFGVLELTDQSGI